MKDETDNKLIKAEKKAAAAMLRPLPDSLNWLYGLGFKLGVLLLLKTFLVLKLQMLNLSGYGLVLCGAQMLLAAVLIACGAAAQSAGVFSDPARLRAADSFYLAASAVNVAVLGAGRLKGLELFVHPDRQSFFTELFSGLKSFSLDLLFADADLWTLAALLIYLTGTVYLLLTHGTAAFKTASPGASRFAAAFIALAAAVSAVLMLAPALSHIGKAQTPATAAAMLDAPYDQVCADLEQAGFENINITAEYKLFTMYVNGCVKSVTIDGIEDFEEGEWYPRSAPVRLAYYSNYKDISNLLKLTEGAAGQIQCPEGSFGWQSADPEVAAVDDTGLVSGVSAGQTEVTFFVETDGRAVRHSCRVEIFSLDPLDWAQDLLKMLPAKGTEE